jgi:hypothetical protein
VNQPDQLSQEAINEFKEIYQREFGEMLSDEQAREKAMSLLNLFYFLLQP